MYTEKREIIQKKIYDENGNLAYKVGLPKDNIILKKNGYRY